MNRKIQNKLVPTKWNQKQFCHIHDSRKSFLRLLPKGRKVTLFLTDPPYNIGMDYGKVSDRLSKEEYSQLLKKTLANCYNAAEENASLFLIHYPEAIAENWDALTSKWKFHQWITWVYPANVGQGKYQWTKTSRAIIWLIKGKPEKLPFDVEKIIQPYRNPWDTRVNGLMENGKKGCALYNWWEINLCKNVSKDKSEYSNQIPELLLKRIILSNSKKGNIVADPFAGTYSTAKAALKVGRLGFGLDMNAETKKYWPTPEDYNPGYVEKKHIFDVEYNFDYKRAGISKAQFIKIIEDGCALLENEKVRKKVWGEIELFLGESKI